MGRFGFVSLGHGAFMGVGAYVPALLWNYCGLTPWIGIPLGVGLRAARPLIVGYPCFRLQSRRPLFRAGDAGAQPGRAALDRRGARRHRRIARLHPEGRRTFLVRAAISGEELLLRHRARCSGWSGLWSGTGSTAASAARRSRLSRRTRTPQQRSASMSCARSCA